MDSLEKYIRENKSRFEVEPEAEHFERMQKKMKAKSSSSGKRFVAIQWGISIAASIALIFIVSNIVFQNTTKQIITCENAINMKICYLEKMYTVAGQIEELIVDFDQWDKQLVMSDVQYIIETVNSDFESEIPEELPVDIAKVILSEYYRHNLESLEMIVESIKNNNM